MLKYYVWAKFSSCSFRVLHLCSWSCSCYCSCNFSWQLQLVGLGPFHFRLDNRSPVRGGDFSNWGFAYVGLTHLVRLCHQGMEADRQASHIFPLLTPALLALIVWNVYKWTAFDIVTVNSYREEGPKKADLHPFVATLDNGLPSSSHCVDICGRSFGVCSWRLSSVGNALVFKVVAHRKVGD